MKKRLGEQVTFHTYSVDSHSSTQFLDLTAIRMQTLKCSLSPTFREPHEIERATYMQNGAHLEKVLNPANIPGNVFFFFQFNLNLNCLRFLFLI